MEQKIENDSVKKEFKDFNTEQDNLSLEEHELYERRRNEKKARLITDISKMLIFITIFILFYFIALNNPGAFKVENETVLMLNNMINAFILLIIPFIFGGIGAATKLSFNNLNVYEHSKVIYSSGFFAAFSWVGMKSQIALSIFLPKADISKVKFSPEEMTQNEFYTMIFLAIIVGMFATNFYVFVNKKVENITNTTSKSENISR